MAVTKAQAFMCLLRAGPLRKLLGKQPPQTNWRSKCFLTWLRAVSEFSLITPQYGQKVSCLHLPSRLNDCLTRHGWWWKLHSKNSLSVPMRTTGGMTAIRLGTPWLGKADNAAGRYFWRPSRVYRGIQSAGAVNWFSGHSTRRPSLLRMGSQCSVITSGSSVSDTAIRGMKQLEFLMSLLEGEAPASNPRRLPLMLWTHSKSEVKTSYLLG